MFYSYGEVQKYLTEFYRKYHYKINFPEALSLMSTRIPGHEYMEYPDFLSWNADDEQELKKLILELPVNVEMLTPGVKQKLCHTHEDSKQIELLHEVGIVLETHDQRSEMHYENYFKLLYVLKGRCQVTGRGKNFEIREQQIVVLSPMLQHQHTLSEDAIVLMIGLSEKTIRENVLPFLDSGESLFDFLIQNRSSGQKGVALLKVEKNRPVYEVIRLLWYYSHKYDEHSIKQMKQLAALFISSAVSACVMTSVTYENDIKYPADKMISDVLRFIKECSSDVTLEMLSKEFSYDKAYLSKKIKRATGKTFSELTMEYRIEKAKALLQNASFSVEEVGNLVGYPSRNNFTSAFKRCTGNTPGEYRSRKSTKNVT